MVHLRQAFDPLVVDLSIAGDVEDVEMEFGLRRQRSKTRPVYPSFLGNPLSDPAEVISGALTGRNAKASAGHRKVGRNDPCSCGSGKNIRSAVCSERLFTTGCFGARMPRLPERMMSDRRRAPS
jgi:hypothetical protein